MDRRSFQRLAVLLLCGLLLVSASTAPRLAVALEVPPEPRDEGLAAPRVVRTEALVAPAATAGLPVVAAGSNTTCVINRARQLFCWGSYSTIPTDLGAVSQVSVGEYHTCVLTSSKALRCWGSDWYGQTTIPRDPLAVVVAPAVYLPLVSR